MEGGEHERCGSQRICCRRPRFHYLLYENDDPATRSGDLQQLRLHHVRVFGWPIPSLDFASYSSAVEQSAPARDVEANKTSARGNGWRPQHGLDKAVHIDTTRATRGESVLQRRAG